LKELFDLLMFRCYSKISWRRFVYPTNFFKKGGIVMEEQVFEVKKVSEEKLGSIEDLEITHKNCYGGKITISYYSAHMLLECNRCKIRFYLYDSPHIRMELLSVAVEGKEKKFQPLKAKEGIFSAMSYSAKFVQKKEE
jgi:hypothetical protein